MFYRLVRALGLTVLRVFFGLRTFGRGNVPRTGGVILAVNHQSYLDPVVVACSLARPVHFMARRTLFRGLFGAAIRALNAFPVARGGADRTAVKEFLSRVRAGKVVMLFPEGTRTPDGRLGAIRPGVGAIAVRADAPVVPTYIDGTFRAWSRHMRFPRTVRVSVRYERPISVARRPGERNRARQDRICSEIVSRLKALEALALSEGPAPGRALAESRPVG